jgi:hypothetical protein
MNHMTELPSRLHATPAEVDAYLRTILAEDVYLRFQQAIGDHAIAQTVEDTHACSSGQRGALQQRLAGGLG